MEELRQLVGQHLGEDPVPVNDIKRILRTVNIDECDIEAALTSLQSYPGKLVSGEEFLAWLYDAPKHGSNGREESVAGSRGILQPPGASTGQALSALPAWGLRQILKSLDYLLGCGYTEIGKLQKFLDKTCASESALVDRGDGRSLGLRARLEEVIGVMMTAGITEVTDLKKFRSAVAGAFITTITGQEPNDYNTWMSEIDLPSHFTQPGYEIQDASKRGISMAQLQFCGDFIKEVLKLKSIRLRRVNHDGDMSNEVYTWDSMDFYGCSWYFSLPLTCKRNVSFVELIASKEQPVVWFISYWWGTPLSQSLRMLQLHNQERGKLGEYYWMDSFTQSRRRRNLDLHKFENSPFMDCLRSETLQGMVALLEARGTAFSRTWTMFECYETISRGKNFDMATWLLSRTEFIGTECNEAQAALLLETSTSTGITYEEVSEDRNLYGYSWSFPKSVVEAAVKARFLDSQCSVEADRVAILQYMKGREAALDTSIHKRFAAKAICYAALDDNPEKLLPLLEEHPEMIDRDLDKFGHSAVFVAASQNASRALKLLINRRASVDTCRQVDGATPVYIAAFKGNVEALKLLVEARADVNTSTEDVGATPAFAAAERNSADIIQVLVAARADVQKRNKQGISPASVAESRGNQKVLELLVGAVAT